MIVKGRGKCLPIFSDNLWLSNPLVCLFTIVLCFIPLVSHANRDPRCGASYLAVSQDVIRTPIRGISVPIARFVGLGSPDRDQLLLVIRRTPGLRVLQFDLSASPQRNMDLNPGFSWDDLQPYAGYLAYTILEGMRSSGGPTRGIYLRRRQHFAMRNRLLSHPFFDDRVIIVEYRCLKVQLLHEYGHDLVMQRVAPRFRQYRGQMYSSVLYWYLISQEMQREWSLVSSAPPQLVPQPLALSPDAFARTGSPVFVDLRLHQAGLALTREMAFEEVEANALILRAGDLIQLSPDERKLLHQSTQSELHSIAGALETAAQVRARYFGRDLPEDAQQILQSIIALERDIQRGVTLLDEP